MIKKILKFIGILLLIFIVLGAVIFFMVNEPKPEGTSGSQADELAYEMLNALNKDAFDTLKSIEFTFRDVHDYVWDLENNSVNVKWDKQEIYLDLNRSTDSFNLLEYKAYKYFINDTFWLVAPFKVMDDGVMRSTVDLGKDRGLLLTYTTGGVTPGDSYLWIIDGRGYPKAWKLWTSNVPIGGLKFSWEGWVNMNEAWFSTLHESAILNLEISNLKVR